MHDRPGIEDLPWNGFALAASLDEVVIDRKRFWHDGDPGSRIGGCPQEPIDVLNVTETLRKRDVEHKRPGHHISRRKQHPAPPEEVFAEKMGIFREGLRPDSLDSWGFFDILRDGEYVGSFRFLCRLELFFDFG